MFHHPKILIFGVTGMLGQALKQAFQCRDKAVIGSAIDGSDYNIDITNDTALLQLLNEVRPAIIINTVAITDCDACDHDIALAYRVNARPSSIITDWAKQNAAYYIYISTDHYFTGDGVKRHDEKTPVVLLNEYARTKYLGEVMTILNQQSLVVRTNIVGFRGWSKPTFVEWAISILKNKIHVTLFNDYYTSSISVSLFSKYLLELIDLQPNGIINLAAHGVFSKKDFVESLAKKMNLPFEHVKIGSVTSLDVCRAESLGLDVSLAETLIGHSLPTLQEVVAQLHLDYQETQR